MPYNKRKQKCTQSDGDKGNYVLSYTDKKGKKRRACHTSKKKMQGQIAAIEMEADGAPGEVMSELRKKKRVTKKQLRKIIREAILLEYEQYVDEDGNVYDDEGNVSRRGSAFGRKYGGETYTGTRQPWSGRSNKPRKTSYVGAGANSEQIAAVEALKPKPKTFLGSILQQLKDGRGLSSKQKAVVRKIMKKRDPQSEKLFENTMVVEGTLYVSRGYMGTPMVEDENEDDVLFGEMIRTLLNAGDDDIFQAPQGVSEKALQNLLKQDKESPAGPIEGWDADVFSSYYNVDLDRVIRLYARLMNHTIEQVSESEEDYY